MQQHSAQILPARWICFPHRAYLFRRVIHHYGVVHQENKCTVFENYSICFGATTFLTISMIAKA